MTFVLNHRLIQTKAFVNGMWQSGLSEKTFRVLNPFDQSTIADVADTGSTEALAAIDAADNAFYLWRLCGALQRAEILTRWAQEIESHVDDLSHLITLEQGKVLKESRAEVLAAAATIRWNAEQGRRIYGDYIEGSKSGTHIFVSHEPLGVVAAITPWNFPIGMITRKVTPALAAGCTVVLKPAEQTPICALALAYLAQKAGLPDGVLNILPTSNPQEVGEVLTRDPRVKKVSFTGSTEIGKILMQQSASTLKKLSLELGGNAPFIVLKDADLDRAVDGAIASKFRNAGQTCVCANRIFVHESLFDTFLKRFVEKVQVLRVGNGLEEGVSIGPLIDEQAVLKIERLLSSTPNATCHLGGKRVKAGTTLFEPTVISGVSDTDDLSCQEIFAPIAAIYHFQSEAEVIQRANATPYGLAAYVYGRDMAALMRVTGVLTFGMVGINEPFLASDLAPFGGVKESGFGREGGIYGVLEYTSPKYRLIGTL